MFEICDFGFVYIHATKFDINTWFAHEPAVYTGFFFFFFRNFVIKQQHWWSSTREISQIVTIQVKRKVERFKECYYVLSTFRRKTSLKFDDFGACCSQESFVWVTLNVFLWPSQELAQKKKKHWLWMMDGQHLFYSWKNGRKTTMHSHAQWLKH